MGRIANRLPCYYFFDHRKQDRHTWFFPSRHAAYKWLRNHYWRYAEFGTLEEYIKSLDNQEKIERACEIWQKHKEGYHAMELRRAYIVLGDEVDGKERARRKTE